jgi:hypothetical protein
VSNIDMSQGSSELRGVVSFSSRSASSKAPRCRLASTRASRRRFALDRAPNSSAIDSAVLR